MNIKIKLLNNGKLPIKKTEGAACYDCYSNEEIEIKGGQTKIIKLGFALELPSGYYAEIRGRSGLSASGILCHIGTIDEDYRGEVGAIITNLNPAAKLFNKGERICQMMIKPILETDFVETDELSETKRGLGGFGSTGTN